MKLINTSISMKGQPKPAPVKNYKNKLKLRQNIVAWLLIEAFAAVALTRELIVHAQQRQP